MKNVQVKVMENGEVMVVGINKDGSASKVEYNVVEVVGLKEFGIEAMKAGAKKQFEAMQQATPKKEEEKPVVNVKKGNEARVKEVVYTKGKYFTNIKKYGTRAVAFSIENKGECTVGFAKDRNAFLESFGGETKEVNRADVLRRLSKYKGNDARAVVQAIKELKPASMVAAHCETCNSEVTHRVKDFSKRHFGKVLCRTCQPNDGGTTKAPERSEGAKPQAEVKPEEHDNIHAHAAAYWEDVCACGETKERAYELCETCRDNVWAEADAGQTTLFSTEDLCVECGVTESFKYGMCQPCMDKINGELMAESLSGASETSANSPEQNVAGEGAQALDMDTLQGLGL